MIDAVLQVTDLPQERSRTADIVPGCGFDPNDAMTGFCQ
jgi:hypothetical protein